MSQNSKAGEGASTIEKKDTRKSSKSERKKSVKGKPTWVPGTKIGVPQGRGPKPPAPPGNVPRAKANFKVEKVELDAFGDPIVKPG